MIFLSQDLRWQFIRAGRAKEYHGPAVHPRHLSLWEKLVLGVHKQYDPNLHKKQVELITHSMSQFDKEKNPAEKGLSGKQLEKLDVVREPSSEDGETP